MKIEPLDRASLALSGDIKNSKSQILRFASFPKCRRSDKLT